MAYSSKEHERFFKPYRVQVLTYKGKSSRSYFSHSPDYQIVLRDATKNGRDAIVDTFLRPLRPSLSNGCWESEKEPGASYHSGYDSKDKAVSQAKRLAVRENLPFDLKRDVISADELINGPEQHCVSCGVEVKRGFEPLICEMCKQDIERGMAVRNSDNTIMAAIEPDRVVGMSSYFAHKHELPSLEEILTLLTRYPVEDSYRNPRKSEATAFVSAEWRMNDIKNTGRVEWHAGWKLIQLTESQLTGLKNLATMFAEIRKDGYEDGYREGSSLLLKMANGELTADQVNDKSVRSK